MKDNMKRRTFLKLIGAIAIAPALPIPKQVSVASPWFIYKGHKFRKDIMPQYSYCVQIYTEEEILGQRYCNAILIDKDDYKYRDMYLDNMICAMHRKRQSVSNSN